MAVVAMVVSPAEWDRDWVGSGRDVRRRRRRQVIGMPG
jgi:hypothetical protein